MTNTIDELMFRIDEIMASPWPELSIKDKEGLIDYYRDLRATYEGGSAPKMKKHEAAPELRSKLLKLGVVKKSEAGSGLRKL